MAWHDFISSFKLDLIKFDDDDDDKAKKKIVMLPSATDRKNMKTRVAVCFILILFFNALNITKLTVFEGKCKNTNK